MFEIKYDFGLNENGRPCIELPEDYDQNPEDKFFAIEIARYYLQMVHARMDDQIYDQNTFEVMGETISLLGQVGDEMAEIQYGNMKTQGELSLMMMDSRYQVMVESIEERDDLPEKDIYYKGKLFDRVEGLKVMVETDENNSADYKHEYFELQNGITNEHWVKL
jgi:hypothetical protein